MNSTARLLHPQRFIAGLLLAISLLGLSRLQAQPVLVSVNPANGATGVSTSTKVVFTFSAQMNTTSSSAFFTNSAGTFFPVTSSWDLSGKVFTCTPVGAFPADTVVYWTIFAFDPSFQPVMESGTFSTGSSGGSTGSGTNKFTSFVVSKMYVYSQTSTGAPTLDTNAPYFFSATTALASNRTATSITLTLPTAAVSNLTQNFVAPEDYYLFGFDTNQTMFENAFPQGGYTFNVLATASNQTLLVTLPLNMAQPNAPHVTNYTAAQAIDATKAFSLGWDAFTGGAGASNFVYLTIASSSTNVFQTGNPGATNALAGTARSVTIPANILQPGQTYDASLGFYHAFLVTNNSVNVSSAFRASATQFTVATTGGVGGPLNFLNPMLSNGTVAFDVSCSAGQTFTIISASDLSLPLAQWTVLLTTNSPGTSIHFVDSRGASAPAMFYRARNGN